MRKIWFLPAGLLIVLLGIFLFTEFADDDQIVQEQEASGQQIKDLVSQYSTRQIQDHTASITSTQLIVMDRNKKQRVYELPEDEFFVSIAPFEKVTHPCAIHSLTGCQGELTNAAFHVTIVDQDGRTIIDQGMNTESNGFMDLWLPRNGTFTVTITRDGKSAEQVISTYEGDQTCITTMQLVNKKSA